MVSSPAVPVTVHSQVTAVRTARGTLTVQLTGAAAQTVQVQQLTGTRWERATTYPATTTHRLTGLRPGTRYRVVVPPTTAIAGSTSAVVVM